MLFAPGDVLAVSKECKAEQDNERNGCRHRNPLMVKTANTPNKAATYIAVGRPSNSATPTAMAAILPMMLATSFMVSRSFSFMGTHYQQAASTAREAA